MKKEITINLRKLCNGTFEIKKLTNAIEITATDDKGESKKYGVGDRIDAPTAQYFVNERLVKVVVSDLKS